MGLFLLLLGGATILKNLYYRDDFDINSIPKLLELVAVVTTEEKEPETEFQITPDEDGADGHTGQPRQWTLGSEYIAADTIERYSPAIEGTADAAQEGAPKDRVKAFPCITNIYKEQP